MTRRTATLLAGIFLLALFVESVPGVRSRFAILTFGTTRLQTWLVERVFSWQPSNEDPVVVLQRQLDAASVDVARLQLLVEENQELRSLVGFSPLPGVRPVASLVIGRDPRDPQTIIRINIGARAGVEVGEAVVSPNGNLIGIVAAVTPSSSTARLLTSHGLIIPVRVPGKAGVYGLLQSSDGLSLSVTQIAKSEPIAVGDIIITNSGALGLPADIPIGVIAEVRSGAEALWQEATVFPFAATATAHIVAILVANAK